MRYKAHIYQQRASNFIVEQPKCGLFLDMGLGKTVSTLTAIRELIHLREEVNKVLIIAPKSVARNTWLSEVEKWTHTKPLRVSLVLGSQVQRQKALETDADIYVINRDNVTWLVDKVRSNWQWDMVVVDESSSFKNPQSKRFKSLKKVLPFIRRLVLLTGTPSPNGLADLYPQIYLLDRGERLGRTLTAYRYNYFKPGKRNGAVIYEWIQRESARDLITAKIKDVCLSMKSEDYLELPKLMYAGTNIALPEKELKTYKSFERNLILEFEENGQIEALTASALINKLCQFTGGAVYDNEGRYIQVSNAKLEALESIMESTEEPVLVYYSYRSEKERILEYFEAYGVETFKGEEDVLIRWNKGQIRMLLCQPQSVAYGLNMQNGGRIIVWYSLTWNLELYQQANARLHRQGQDKPVLLYRLVARNTIDEKIQKALEEKDISQEKLLESLK